MTVSPKSLLIFFNAVMIVCGLSQPVSVIQKFFSHCSDKPELVKCLKIQALKVSERAIRIRSFNVVDGLSIVTNDRAARSVTALPLNSTKLEQLPEDELDGLLEDSVTRFLDTHKIEVDVPKLVEESGRGFGVDESSSRKKGDDKDKGGSNGALLAALAIKGSFLAMAYKGIAIMSGTALLVGKMALVLSAILGLKKLVTGTQEKTTFEIIKTPKYTEEHVHSTVHEDDHHDHFRRNYLDTGEVHKRVYRIRIPPDNN